MGEIPKELLQYINAKDKAKEEMQYHEKQMKLAEQRWRASFKKLDEECNHRYADGSSAMEHGYAFSQCRICSYDDL